MWDDIDWGFGDGGSADWLGGTSDSVWSSVGDSGTADSWWDSLGSGSGSSGSSWGSILGGLFGGGSGGESGSGSNIWGQMLAGAVGGAGTGKMKEAETNLTGEWAIRRAQEEAKQQRQTVDFTAELKDYYDQKNKAVKRNALDTYGQFSLTDRYAPSMAKVAPVAVPTKPALN